MKVNVSIHKYQQYKMTLTDEPIFFMTLIYKKQSILITVCRWSETRRRRSRIWAADLRMDFRLRKSCTFKFKTFPPLDASVWSPINWNLHPIVNFQKNVSAF